LHECLPQIARTAKASLVVLKDFPSKYRNTLAGFSHDGFTRVPSMPMTRLALNFRDFHDYLAHLSYGTRKSLRRKFRKTERAAKIELEIVGDVTPHLEEVYPLYLAVHERSPMKFEKLTKEYLSKLNLYLKHTQPLLNPIFRRVVRLLEPTRHDPVLPKFSNAAELYE